MTTPLLLAEATPDVLAAQLEANPSLVLPIGTIEYHGGHLPLGLDGIKAASIARAAATAAGAVLAPTCWWAADGVPRELTLRLPASALEPPLVEALRQLAGIGFETIALVNGHFGLENSRLVRRAALEVMATSAATVVPIADYEVLLELGDDGDHAGRWETALLLGTRPELVRLDAIPEGVPVDGVIGADPRDATVAEGRAGIAHAGERIATAIARARAFSEGERAAFVAALRAALEALDGLAALRSARAREDVPPVLTPAWRAHLTAMDAGDFAAARDHAERKRDDPGA